MGSSRAWRSQVSKQIKLVDCITDTFPAKKDLENNDSEHSAQIALVGQAAGER